MADKPPPFVDDPPPDATVVLVSPTVHDEPMAGLAGWTAGDEYHCETCGARLALAPSSQAWLAAHPAATVLHLCGRCAEIAAPAMTGPDMPELLGVELVPGGDRDLKGAGLDEVAAADEAVRNRWRRLFGTNQ